MVAQRAIMGTYAQRDITGTYAQRTITGTYAQREGFRSGQHSDSQQLWVRRGFLYKKSTVLAL